MGKYITAYTFFSFSNTRLVDGTFHMNSSSSAFPILYELWKYVFIEPLVVTQYLRDVNTIQHEILSLFSSYSMSQTSITD